MSSVDQARRTKVRVAFAGVDITEDINKYLISMTYTDNETDQTDDLRIDLDDREDVWLLQWLNTAIQAAAQAPSPHEAVAAYTVTAKTGLNIRSGPGTSYSKLGAFSYGASIQVESVSNGWGMLAYGGKTAYVSADYIEPAAAATAPVWDEIKGMRIQAVIVRENWNSDGKDDVLDCGDFELDYIETGGPPSGIVIKGTSLPYKTPVRQTKKSKAWEEYPLSGIAGEIAAQNSMSVLYESSIDPLFARVEQVMQSDIDFLSDLCQRSGVSLKATSNILVLFDQAEYEAKTAVRTITKGEKGNYISYRMRTGENDTQYGACRVSYTDPATGTLIDYTYQQPDAKEDSQTLEVRRKVSSIGEAAELAEKLLRLKNKYEYSADFTLEGDPNMVAGVTVELAGWGAFSGKYIVSQARHSVGSSGYQVSIKLRRVLEGY